MSLLRRTCLSAGSSGRHESTPATQIQSGAPQTLSPLSQTHGSHSGDDVEEATTTPIARMKKAAGLALGLIQTGSRLAAQATSDVGVPGLSVGLSALAEILHKVQV